MNEVEKQRGNGMTMGREMENQWRSRRSFLARSSSGRLGTAIRGAGSLHSEARSALQVDRGTAQFCGGLGFACALTAPAF